MAEFKNKSVLAHLIKRLDERYLGDGSDIPDETLLGILNGTINEQDLEGDFQGSSGPVNPIEDVLTGDDNATGPKSNRVLNYPGLQHLVARLDFRYSISRITNSELEEMLV